MSQPPNPAAQQSKQKPLSKEGSGRYVQEKIMLALALVFFVGTVALTIVPAPYTGVVMTLIVTLTLLAMFRFN